MPESDSPLDVPLAALAPTSAPDLMKKYALIALAILLLPLWLPLTLLLSPAITILALGGLGLFRPMWLRGLPRDINFIVRLVSATRQLEKRLRSSRGQFTVADYWAETAAKHGSKEALIFEGSVYTYAEVDTASSRVAHWAHSRGLRAGDGVALLCANRPEHLFTWLGLAKIGVSTTLVNPALRGASLRHALAQCAITTLIFDAASAAAVDAAIAAVQADDTSSLADRAAAAAAAAYDLYCIDAPPADAPGQTQLLELPALPLSMLPTDLRASCRSTDAALHVCPPCARPAPTTQISHLTTAPHAATPMCFGAGS